MNEKLVQGFGVPAYKQRRGNLKFQGIAGYTMKHI